MKTSGNAFCHWKQKKRTQEEAQEEAHEEDSTIYIKQTFNKIKLSPIAINTI